MKPLWCIVEKQLRGPRARGWLQRAGIDPRKYWLLIDLFGELSERRELFSQLGNNAAALKKASWVYFGLSALITIPLVLADVSVSMYAMVFLGMTAFLLTSMLLPETSNSLVNPVEGMVLAHQPIDGATYTAAKLTHLSRILLYMVPGLNLAPAVVALFLPHCPWYFPLLLLAAAFAMGTVIALTCCALFGWLIRFVPPARLKTVGFMAEMAPWLIYLLSQVGRSTFRRLHWPAWLRPDPWILQLLAVVLVLGSVAMVILGLRALSGDYLARVSAIAHGGSGKKSRPRRSWSAALAAAIFGGPSVRAAYDYVTLMMRRDWQFRRQLIPLIPMTAMAMVSAARNMSMSPFSAKFSAVHVLPHAFGFAFFIVCGVMMYGRDHQGSWVFQLAPAGAFRGFARGVYARLLSLLLAPHILMLLLFTYYWGVRDAVAFVIYSAAAGAVYLSLELRLVEVIPFSKQPEATQNYLTMLVIMGGIAAAGIAVAVQHFLLFRSMPAVIGASALLLTAAWLLTRSSLDTYEAAMRFQLGIMSSEVTAMYKEVEM